MFVLPSKFNVITDLKHMRSGVTILVPHTGQPKKLQTYLEKTAIEGAHESNIVGVMIALTTNISHWNDYDAAAAHALPNRADYSYCSYRRINTLVFNSTVLDRSMTYRDYTFILNVMMATNGITMMDPDLYLDKIRNWMRYYELTFRVNGTEVEFYRNETLYISVPRQALIEMLMESLCMSAFSALKVRGSCVRGVTKMNYPQHQQIPRDATVPQHQIYVDRTHPLW